MSSCLVPRWLWPWGRQQPRKVFFFGLNSSGKTTILYKLVQGQVVTTIPTIGFDVKLLDHKGCSLQLMDVGYHDGTGSNNRFVWRAYYTSLKAVIWVVDATDATRIDEAREVFLRELNEDELRDVVLLVYANKQDLPGALSSEALAQQLGLDSFSQNGGPRRWHCQPASAVSGEGLHEGLDWLCDALVEKKR